MKNRGFTLIELVVVLILIGVSAALLVPGFTRISKSVELRATAKKVSGLLRYYRNEAVQRGKVYQVLFDFNLREIRVQSVEIMKSGEQNEETEEMRLQQRFPMPADIQVREMKIPGSLYVSEYPVIEFYPNGGSNGGSFILDLQSSRGYWIRVHFLTGIVDVKDG
jgi:prepilin-type N-terminal cleavage/methylation domain-containing protein